MPDYSVEIKPPEKMEMIVSGADGQQITLDPAKFQRITFDYDGDTLIFQGTKVQAVASLKCISDVFWMMIALTSKGFEFRPNEAVEMLKKVLR